jgi:hypothetical protein
MSEKREKSGLKITTSSKFNYLQKIIFMPVRLALEPWKGLLPSPPLDCPQSKGRTCYARVRSATEAESATLDELARGARECGLKPGDVARAIAEVRDRN